MKKLFLTGLLVTASLLSTNTFAQKKKDSKKDKTEAADESREGSVTFKISLDGLPPEQAAMMGDMEMKMFYKGKKSRMEQSMGMMGTTITITDGGPVVHQLSESMMGKTYVKIPKDSVDKKDESDKKTEYKITYLEEKKTIANYECKKAIIEFKNKAGDTQKSEVWYSDKLPKGMSGGGNKRMEMFKELKGVPLKWSMNQGPVTINIEAKEVSDAPIPDSKFVVDATGYTEMSYAEYIEQMKAMGQGQ